MTFPLVFLAVPSLIIGFIGFPWDSKIANLLDPEEAEIAAKAFEIKEFLPLAIASVLIASAGITIAYQAYFVKKINLAILFAEKFPSINKFFHWSVIKEEDWLTSWKQYWAPELVGNHFLILPCWINLDDKFKDKQVIKIDPGAAYGTGNHPSTYLCLEKMENILFFDKKVLDIGSGSGILSIAARLLGAKEVCAVDNDYLAINSTNSNFQLNFGNLKNLNTYLGPFNEVILENQLKQFDFVLCNILAEVIKEMIPNIYKCLRNNGEVILSGILNSQKDEIIKILIQNDLKLLDVSTRKDWACISAQKTTDPI